MTIQVIQRGPYPNEQDIRCAVGLALAVGAEQGGGISKEGTFNFILTSAKDRLGSMGYHVVVEGYKSGGQR